MHLEFGDEILGLLRPIQSLHYAVTWSCSGTNPGWRAALFYGILHLSYLRRVEAVHSACVECAEAFGTHWEPSHVAMATDCLPALQLMCHSENLREAANTKRRYTNMPSLAAVTLALLPL